MIIYSLICLVLLGVVSFFIGMWSVEKQMKDTWKDEKEMEFNKSRELADNWEKQHYVLNSFQGFYYKISRIKEMPRDIYQNIKWFIQRGSRGFADCDVWSFDSYLSNIIVNGLKNLKENVHGHPINIGNKKERNGEKVWKNILDEIIWTFEVSEKIQNHAWILITSKKQRTKFINETKKYENKDIKYHIMSEEELKRYKDGWILFRNFYYNLWD
jgi:hypothetical protein